MNDEFYIMVDGNLIPCTPEQLADIKNKRDNAIKNNLLYAKQLKKDEINTSAGNARKKYITDIPGQESTYQFKLQEAQLYVETQNPIDINFPFLYAEASACKISISDLANSILQIWTMWKQIAADIEATRRGAMIEIDTATTVDEVMSINPIFP